MEREIERAAAVLRSAKSAEAAQALARLVSRTAPPIKTFSMVREYRREWDWGLVVVRHPNSCRLDIQSNEMQLRDPMRWTVAMPIEGVEHITTLPMTMAWEFERL